MSKKLTFAFSLALAVLPLSAHALGLGEIKLNSALNDKFSADIQVVGASSDELDSLDVKLADFAKFTQAGLDRPGVLDQLQFVVVRNPDGTAYIHITSTQPVREPFLDFLLDANWNNGELIREYTVLLNPPTFQSANAAKPTPAPAPAAASVPAPVAAVPATAPAPSVAAPAQASAPPAVAAVPQAPPAAASAVPAAAASPPPAPTPSAEQAPAQRALGANYGPIHRGETLSGIAKSVRPEGVTLNQMMIAIYQANPEVFMHNINRMKAGYILRMPTASDAQAVSVVDANAQVREQIEAWRNKTPAEAPTPPPPATTAASAASTPTTPALQLVAPSSAASSNAPVPGAEKQGTGETAVKGHAPGKNVVSTVAAPPLPTTSQAPISVNSNSMAAVQQQATQQNVAPPPPNPVLLPPPAAATNVPLPKPATPKAKPVVPAQPAESGGIMDMLLSIYSLFALIAIAVVVLLVVMIKKRKGSGSKVATPGRIKGADWLKQESVDSGGDTTEGSSTTRTKAGKAKKAAVVEDQEKTVLTDAPTEVSGGADSDKTMLMAAPPPAATGDTMVGGAPADGGAKLDVSDPMAEADFHMAYGLYDQAADVLRKALRQDPNRRDLHLKILEVFFTAGDKSNFVGEAKKLRQSMGAAPDKDWESVAIMGRQVAPDDPLFSSTGAPSGAGAVDIALDAGGTDTVVADIDALGGAFSAPPPMPSAPPAAPAADNSLEFSIPDLEPAAAPPAPAPAAEAPQADAGMEFNLGDLNFEPTPAAPKTEQKKAPAMGTDEPTVATDFGTDSQVEFDKALNDLASFVNTNVPPQPADASEPQDKTLAIRPPTPATAEPVAAEAAGGASISEIGTKLDLARAYIDMGDPDGAKSILEEVVAEGNVQQKQEAQELLKHVT